MLNIEKYSAIFVTCSAMAPEWLSEKNFKRLKYEHITYSFEARDLEISNM